jgi:hypothetical protein
MILIYLRYLYLTFSFVPFKLNKSEIEKGRRVIETRRPADISNPDKNEAIRREIACSANGLDPIFGYRSRLGFESREWKISRYWRPTTMKQVTCINKRPSHYDPHARIHSIGGVLNGSRWKDSEDVAIANVKRDPQSYYVSVGTHSVWVIVATHNGREYLKTQADGHSPDNLLALPECP